MARKEKDTVLNIRLDFTPKDCTRTTPRWEEVGDKSYYNSLTKAERQAQFVDVYLGKIPENVRFSALYPAAREEEVAACKNERVRREKYCAWKLLGYAFQKSFGVDIRDLPFVKLPTGKWQTEGYSFSISHTDGLVVVGVAREPIGVDAEKFRPQLLRLGDKILTEGEKTEYAKIPKAQKEGFLLRSWTVKESIFKAFGKGGFLPREIDCGAHAWAYGERAFQGEIYAIAVAMYENKSPHWEFVKDYLSE